MNEAIKLAIEKGGYLSEHFDPLDTVSSVWSDQFTVTNRQGQKMYFGASQTFLDPLFWQALGKALGWTTDLPSGQPSQIGWLYHWHRFIDWIAEGKNSDDFFAELLKEKV